MAVAVADLSQRQDPGRPGFKDHSWYRTVRRYLVLHTPKNPPPLISPRIARGFAVPVLQRTRRADAPPAGLRD